MNNLIHTAVVTLFAASTAQAQQAVQWKLSDGGNGHWYQVDSRPLAWADAHDSALNRGGHLATVASEPEQNFLWSLANPVVPGQDLWLGAYQMPGSCEPGCGWTWVTGEPFGYSKWDPGEPNNNTVYGNNEDAVCVNERNAWNDLRSSAARRFVIEWDADCNGDGIVDYGQCHDGTLPDYNGNNLPDCCERGEACTIGSYPVQWRIEDGGNGHWYEVHVLSQPTSWPGARTSAKSLGGDLASLESTGEPGFVYAITGNPAGWGSRVGPWLGGFQDTAATDYIEPDRGWRWTSGAPWQFADWEQGEPNNGFSSENYLHLISNSCPGFPAGRFYNDLRGEFGELSSCELMPISAVIEWSNDCTNDGIVDYGQILQGQLADMNQDGVPDICQQPTCRDADLFRDINVNGADLGILLSQWGLNSQFTVSDINKDGSVNGADLGLLLSFWGACP